MAENTTDITTLSQSFGTIIENLKNYSGDDTGLTGKDAKALNGIISGLSTLQSNLNAKPDNETHSRLDNIKGLTNPQTGLLSAFNSNITNLNEIQTNVANIATFLTTIGNSFKKFKADTVSGVDVGAYIKPITDGIGKITEGFKDYIEGGSQIDSLKGLLNETKDITEYKDADGKKISVEQYNELADNEKSGYTPIITTTVTKKGLIGTLDDVKKFLNTSMGMILTLVPNNDNNAEKINTKGAEINTVFGSIKTNILAISDSISKGGGAFKSLTDTLKNCKVNDISETTVIKNSAGKVISDKEYNDLSADEKQQCTVETTKVNKGIVGDLDNTKTLINKSMAMLLTLLPDGNNGGNNAHKINTKGAEITAVFTAITDNIVKISDSISKGGGAFKSLTDTLKNCKVNDISETTVIKNSAGKVISDKEYNDLSADEKQQCTVETTKVNKGIVGDLDNTKTLINKSMAMLLTLLPDDKNGGNNAHKLNEKQNAIENVFKAITGNIITISDSLKNSDGAFNKLNSALSNLQLADIEETLTYTNGEKVITAAQYEDLPADKKELYYGHEFKPGSKGLTSKLADVKSFLTKTMPMLISLIPGTSPGENNTTVANNAKKIFDSSNDINKVIDAIKTSLDNIAKGMSEGGSILDFSDSIANLQLADILGAETSDIDYYTNDKGVRISTTDYDGLTFDKRVGYTPVFKKTGVSKKGLTSAMADVKKFLDGSIKAIASIIPDKESNPLSYSILNAKTDDINKVISKIQETLQNMSSSMNGLKTDMFDDIITNLKLGQTEDTASYYEHNTTKHRLTRSEYDKLLETNGDKAGEYTFKTEKKDISMSESIRLVGSFITETIKSIEKVSSVSMKTVVLAPVKMKMISNTIQKSITSMITAVDSINKTAADHNIHQLLGWEEGNNQYLINADGSYKMEEYTEGDKTEMRKIENARYTKGHFKAETGLFKLGDYVATLIGIVEKIGNINPLTIKKSSVKIKMCIGLIAKSVADIANALATEMKGVSEKMTSEDMEIMLGVTRKDVYQIGTKGEANQIGEVKQEGLFTGLLTFFSIYDNMMKIAAEGGIKVIMQTEIAKMRILRIIEAMASISEALMTSNVGDSTKTINAINSLKDSINSLKSIASGLADSKLASNTTIAERTIKSMRDIFDMLIGKGNDDKEQPILLKLSQLTSKYEEMNKDSKGPSSLKSLTDDMKSISGIVASFALMSLMAPIAITGVMGTKAFLSIFLGRDPKTGKEDGKTTGGGIIGMIIKLRQRWDEAENVSGSSVRTTLLVTSGSLILFMGAFVIIGKLAGAAIKGVALTGAMIVLILAIFKVVQFIAKMGKNRDTGDGSILSKLFTAKEQKSQIPSVKTMLMIAGGFIMFVMSLSLISLFGKYAIKGMLVVAGLLIMTMGILWIVNKIATMGKTLKQRMFDVGMMKMGSDIPAIRMLLGISAGIILFTVSLSLVALFAPYAFKGLLAFTGLVMSALLLLTLVMKIASIGSNIADKFNIKGLLGGDNNIPAIKMLLMISAGFLMFTMSLILIQLVKSVAWEGLLAVTLMVTMTLGVLMVLSSMDKNIGDARKALIGVATAMLGFTLSLIMISVLIKAVGFGVVMGSLLTLLIGVGICVAALYLINKIGVADVTKGAISLLIMSAAFIVFGIALKIISNALNVLSWENIGKLVLVVGMFIGVTILAGLSIVYISIGSVAMGLMSGALLLFAVMLDKLANAMKDVSIDTFATLPSIMGMLLLVLSTAALGILTVPIGSMVVTMMSGSLLLFGEMLDKMKKSIKGVTTDMFKDLPSIMGSLQVVFLKAALGILTVPIGAGVIMMMHKPLLALSELLPKMKDAVRGMKGADFEQLSDIMSELRAVFKQASLGFFAITIGTPVILMLSGTMTVFSEALSKIKPNITGLSVDEFNSLPTIMDSLVDTFSTAALGILTVPIGAGVIMMMTAPLLMMSKAFVNIREAFKGMNVKKGDNPFENMIGGMIKGIGTFITEVRNVDIKFKDILKLNRLRLLSRNISEIALLLSDIANMQIACAWDKEGNPTKYRQMTTNDFRMAKDNVSLILAAMIDISKSISEEGAGKELKNMNRREIKRQARRMNAVMRIVEPISTMVDFIKSLAEGKLTIYDDKTQKDKTISFNEYFGNEAIRGNIKTNIGNLILFINDITKDIGAEDSKYKMEKGDRKAAEKQADRMAAAMGIIDPLMSLVDFIKLLSEGTIEHVDDNGKKTKISISKLIHDETLRNKIKGSTLGLMEMMNAIAHDINESNLEVEEIDADNLMTNAETINSVMASISNIANAKSTNSYVKVADSTSKLVHAINELDATKGSVFKDILYDLEKMNYSLGDVFDRIENAIVRLSTELGKMNGVELKSVTSEKSSSSSSSAPMQNTISPNLTNIESDVDDLLNELRSIKALMQR